VQSHLSKVYGAVAVAVASTALGVYLHMLTGFGGLLSFFASLGVMIWILSDPEVPNTPKVRGLGCKRDRLACSVTTLWLPWLAAGCDAVWVRGP